MVKKTKKNVVDSAAADANVQTMCNDLPPKVQRRANGTVLPGSALHLKHGLYSKRHVTELFREQAQPLQEREAEILNDLGGADHVSHVLRGLVPRYVTLEAIADNMERNIMLHGVLTGKGKTRAATTTYLHVIDRLQRMAVTIGLKRRAKRAPDIRDWWAANSQLQPQEHAK